MSRPRSIRVPVVLLGLAAAALAGCGKARPSRLDAVGSHGAAVAPTSEDKGDVSALLTKEEVSSIVGEPVTTVEHTGRHSVTYKTAVLGLEAHIEVEQKRGVAGAVQAMQGARTATGFLGGEPEAVPGLGDEALFGAMSTLYVRKGNVFITIQPPNLQQVGGFKAYKKVTEAKGQDETIKAMEELKAVEKTDPAAVGLNAVDATQGALATIKASSRKQGTQYETDARAMAQALAARLVEKL